MMPPTSIDGTDITGATIDGQDVQEITVDGQTVFTGGLPDSGVIDDFEDYNGVSLSDRYSGDTNDYDVQTATVFSGNQALETLTHDKRIISINGDGLNFYPEQGQVFEGYVRGTNNSQMRTLYGVVDDGNFYQMGVSTRDNALRFRKVVNSTESDLDIVSTSLSTGTWYRVEISWGTNNEHNILVEETGSSNSWTLSATDSEFEGEVGFGISDGGSNGGDGIFDGYQIIGLANN